MTRIFPPTDDETTLCDCLACEGSRKRIRKSLLQFPPEIDTRSVCAWLNDQYAEMRKHCLRKEISDDGL